MMMEGTSLKSVDLRTGEKERYEIHLLLYKLWKMRFK